MIRLQRILFPTDFSECANSAQQYACALAGQFEVELHLLHVLQDLTLLMLPEPATALALPASFLETCETEAKSTLARLLDPSWCAGRRVVYATRTGNPALEIDRYATETDIGLIVIGTHGRSGFSHVLLGSIAERVVRRAPCPVLTVRPQTRQLVSS